MIKDKGWMVAEKAENPTRCSTKLIYDVRTVDYTWHLHETNEQLCL